MKLKIPKPLELIELYQDAMEDQTEEQFQTRFLASVIAMINKNPLWYRAYGVYWWQVKQLLINRGLIELEHVDAEWFEKTQYDNATYYCWLRGPITMSSRRLVHS